MSERVSLEPVDAANVTVLVDNFIDALLPSSEVAQRPQVAYEMWECEREQLIAEHGLSLLLTIERDGRSASLIYDAGLSLGVHVLWGWAREARCTSIRRRRDLLGKVFSYLLE
jgi:hypothetical protein